MGRAGIECQLWVESGHSSPLEYQHAVRTFILSGVFPEAPRGA